MAGTFVLAIDLMTPRCFTFSPYIICCLDYF